MYTPLLQNRRILTLNSPLLPERECGFTKRTFSGCLQGTRQAPGRGTKRASSFLTGLGGTVLPFVPECLARSTH